MKKRTFLFALSLVMMLGANAQEYRKSWNFTKWSDATVADLKAGNDWSDIEKAADTKPTDISKDNCFWEVKAAGKKDEVVTLTANGNVIKELEGLYYTNTTDRSLAIAVNYPSTSIGTYYGPSYLWFGGSKKDYFVIPHVAPGTEIKIGVESHKSAEARGVELYINNNGEHGTKLKDPDGNEVAVPKEYQDLVWLVPADATDTPNEDGTFDIQLYNTNGCHLYYITVGDGSQEVEDPKTVAYVTNNEESLGYDFIYTALSGNTAQLTTTLVYSSEVSSLEALQEYDVVAVSPFVSATDPIVSTLKSAIAYQPILNFNASLYEAWGYGKAVPTEGSTITIAPEEYDNDIFTDMDVTEGLNMLLDGTVTGVELGNYFANDKVIGKVGETVAIHQHNPGRNTYLFIPLTVENAAVLDFENMASMLGNAAVAVAKSKAKVTAVAAPTITKVNKNKATEVTLSNSNKSAVMYYTIDKSEPTTASTLYTEPFTLTDSLIVKAIAVADGYTPSAVSELKVDIKEQAAAPVITVTKKDDNSEVTITCATEDASIYYSYNAVSEPIQAQKYENGAVIKLTEPTGIFAFAVSDKYVQSEMASAYVEIPGITAQTIRLDTLAHFDANETDWFLNDTENGGTGAAKAYYYWGKSSWEYYSNEIDHDETVVGSDGKDSLVHIFKPDPAAVREAKPNTPNGWILKSAGQVLTGELTDKPGAIVGNGETGYYAETAEDLIGGAPTKGKISFGGKNDGNPYTGSIETTDKYTAPFDVVTYVANGSPDGKHGILEIQVSADGVKWDSIGTVNMSDQQRYYKRTRVSHNVEGDYYVRVAQTGGASKAQVYDIYILNNGEVSQKYDPAVESGIESVNGAAAATLVSNEVFSVNGARLNSLQKGLNIVRKHYSDGSVKTVKVIVR